MGADSLLGPGERPGHLRDKAEGVRDPPLSSRLRAEPPRVPIGVRMGCSVTKRLDLIGREA